MDPDLLEICFNLWPVIDEETQLVYAYMGKAYAMRGTEDSKLRTLHALAAEDHITVPKRPLPQRFESLSPDGQRAAMTSIDIVNSPDSRFWEELMEKLMEELPPVTRFIGTRAIETRLPLSDGPLTCVTPILESTNGTRTPLPRSFPS